ncbi:CRISPR-associated CARF protein Csx1 [Thermococcus henrietii]|uniref:CRISPR-associated CARF protein Csx1 n=1 Tax=Thermococcus henrietii TaxID=2016361 RepID=UPI000C07F10E|nr:CRISPR-associated CARF protein Csx1 [Thermococcus henrietii]
MERVLVATWGNPFQWEEVRYSVDCSQLGAKDCENVDGERGNVSTLPVLLKALKPRKTIILVLDTLVNLTLKNDVKPNELNSYEDVVGDIEERVRWFIENRVKPLMEEKDRGLLDSVKIVVLPGVGEFNNVSVEGDVLDFYSSVLRVLAEELPTGDTEVFLDLTHGINFMPVLTYRALKNLLGLLAYVRKTKLYVVNSEPFPQGDREWKEKILKNLVLHIRPVETVEIMPKPLYSTVSDKPEWSAFISSVTNGFPLAFATFYPDVNKVKKYVDNAFSKFLEEIDIEVKNDKAKVKKAHIKRKTALSEDFRTAVKLYYMLRVFKGVLDGEYPKKSVTLDDLFRITRTLFVNMPRIGIVVEDQLCNLKRLQEKVNFELKKRGRSMIRKEVRRKLENGGISLAELYDGVKFRYSSGGRSHNPKLKVRNFIAHSGFEFNLTRVKVEDVIRGSNVEKVFVFSYSDPEAVMRLSIEALSYRDEEVTC